MLIFLRKLGTDYRALRTSLDVVKTFPFSSAKKRMSTLVRSSGNEGHLYTKGASEIIAEMCNSYLANDGTTQTIDAQMREEIMGQITTMASAGLRTISIAYSPVSDLDATKALEDAPGPDMAMIFIGIVGIRDPPRKVSTASSPLHDTHLCNFCVSASSCFSFLPLIWFAPMSMDDMEQEVPGAVKQCQMAGIKVRMITGDNVLTAKSIAREIGILTDGAAIEGPDFRKMTPEQQRDILKTMQVMARCSPQDKLTMVRRLKEMGDVRSSPSVNKSVLFC